MAGRNKPSAVQLSLKKQKIDINNPSNRLDIVHVYDIIGAYIKLKENILDFEKYETFNVAKDINYSIEDIYSAIKFNLNIDDKLSLDEEKIPIFSNPSKIKDKLDWEPKIGIFEGLNNTIDYYRFKYKL